MEWPSEGVTHKQTTDHRKRRNLGEGFGKLVRATLLTTMPRKQQQHLGGQFNFTSSHGQFSIPTHSTEFCVRASKLNFGKDKTSIDCSATSLTSYRGSGSTGDMVESQRLYKRGLITQASSSSLSLPEVASQRLDKAQSLGIMGQKYFKKHQPNKETDKIGVKTQECSSYDECTSSPRNLQPSANDNKQKVGKEAKHETSFVISEFGFRCGRTDAFSGNTRKRVVESSEFEKHIAEGARKHIIACHIAPTARRGCPAIQSYHALRDSVSPLIKRSKHTRSEMVSTSMTDHRNKPCIAKLKLSNSTVTMSATSLSGSPKTKLPEVVGTLVQQATKPIHQAA